MQGEKPQQKKREKKKKKRKKGRIRSLGPYLSSRVMDLIRQGWMDGIRIRLTYLGGARKGGSDKGKGKKGRGITD